VARLIWSPQARDDLYEIHQHIARDSLHYADRYLDRIVDAVERVEQFPRTGRIVPERRRDDIREIVVRSHRVIYRISADEIEIVTVLHGARRLSDILGL